MRRWALKRMYFCLVRTSVMRNIQFNYHELPLEITILLESINTSTYVHQTDTLAPSSSFTSVSIGVVAFFSELLNVILTTHPKLDTKNGSSATQALKTSIKV